MKERALARPGGTDDRHLLAGADVKGDVVEDDAALARRISEAHVLEVDLATARHRHRDRMRRNLDRRLDRHEFRNASGSPRCERDFAPDLAQLAERARREYRIEQELAEPAGTGASGEHVLRADPEEHDDAGE